tara:strand:+ start:80 stop:316 length:237 start_codon:yes stop_codon:yes gene_type:complete
MKDQRKVDTAAAHVREMILASLTDIKKSIEHDKWMVECMPEDEDGWQNWGHVGNLNRTQAALWEICHNMKLPGYHENE